MRTRLSRRAGRGRVLTVAVTLVTSVVAAVASPQSAHATGGPSVDLPAVPSTAVSRETMAPRGADQATLGALNGNQPGGNAVKDGGGTPKATSLSPSASWDVAAHTGDFSWSYPLRVPPAAGGLEPKLALSYQSSAVDGRTSATNNQPSWVGDGWELSSGFVERTYTACADDEENDAKPKTSDLCWRSDNATASFAGGGGMLIHDAGKGWRTKNDSGARIEQLTGAGNGARNGEYWKITTVDGTQYKFGSLPSSKSTWTVPVFGDDKDEPCHGTTFETSSCDQGWRWNLDEVVDRHGNAVRYFYDTESNSYGMNRKDAAVSYIRGGTLNHIDYGLRDDVTASGKVVFGTADRCVPDSPCKPDNKANWPDTALDEKCDTPTCKDHHSPTFWSTKRLATITTQVWRGSKYDDVDRWSLEHQFPASGDGENAALWLRSVKHTGLVGGERSLPAVTFEGTKFPNRVYGVDGIAWLNRYRVTGIVAETGGVTSVTYASECKDGGPKPDKPETNTLRCFPARWSKKNYEERLDYFHKYVVTQVVQSDRLSSSTEQVTSYEYLDGAAWHWDTSEFVKDDKKTWNEFRGYGRVRVRRGAPNDPGDPVTMSEQRFYRGMKGDRRPASAPPPSVSDSEGRSRTEEDWDWLAGFEFESATFEREGPSNQPDPPRVAKTLTDPWWRGPTASRGAFQAYLVRPGTQRTFTALESGGRRETRSETSYTDPELPRLNDFGLPLRVNDLGDVGTAEDDRCVRTGYAAPKPGKWLMNLAVHIETVSVHCGQTPVFPADAISDTRNSYDDENGNLIKVEAAKERPANEPEYVTTATYRYDAHGRVVESTDVDGNKGTTVFTPSVGGPVTQSVATTPGTATVPGGLVTTTTVEPAWGVPTLVVDPNRRKTQFAYDPLGRSTEVWLPNRPSVADGRKQDGSFKFDYQIRDDGMTAVTTTRLNPRGESVSSNTLYDGMLRPRQTQTPAVGGGRLLTDTRYDSQGRVYKSTQPYFNDGAVDTTLWVAADTEIPGHTRTGYDGAGRATKSVYYAGAIEKWSTTTKYGGDRVHTTPPEGGTPTTVITDARGRTTESRQYTGPGPSGDYQATGYTYTKAGSLATVTDPDRNIWRYTYDLRGRKLTSEDPDSGTTTMTYDDAGRLTSSRDFRNNTNTIAYAYDALGRKTGSYVDKVGGRKLAEWTYDTAARGKGLPASATRWIDDKAYTTTVDTYDAMAKPSQTSVTIPAAEGLLAGTYTASASYNVDGSVAGETYAAAGELPAETVGYRYNALGLPTTSSGGSDTKTVEHVTETTYTRYGELARLQLGEGTKRTWLSNYYDAKTRRLDRTIVDAEVPHPMQADFHYNYDPAGNIASIADTPRARPTDVPGAQSADVQCFGHDRLRRLTEAWTPKTEAWSAEDGCKGGPDTDGLAGPAPYWHSYRHDKIGNRVEEVQHAAAGDTTRSYTYGSPQPHTLRKVTTTGLDTPDSFSYDPAGNTIGRTVAGKNQVLDWDLEGHLASVTEGDKKTSFVYDASGSRLIRRDPTGTTLYLGNQELRVNKGGGNPTVTRYYTHGGAGIAMRQGKGSLTWLMGDHQGTAQIAIDSGSQQVTRRRQLPFGGPRGVTGSWPGERGFVGGTQDASTGLTHLGARDYDPDTGRFISVDPVMNPADSQQMNGYSYSNNNPITFSDPSGEYCDSCDYYSWRDKTYSPWRPESIIYKDSPSPAVAQQREQIVTGRNKNPHIQPKLAGHRMPTFDEMKANHPVRYAEGSRYSEAIADWANDKCMGHAADEGFCVAARDAGLLRSGDPVAAFSALAGLVVGALVTAGCAAATAGAGSVLCAVAGDVAGSATSGVVSNLLNGGDPVTGAAQGAALGLLTGPLSRAGGRAAARACSFSADTNVVLADGTSKPFSEVKVGDQVLATDPETGEKGARTVTAVLVHEDTVLDLVTEDGAAVTTTRNHPFWNDTDRRWERADELDSGDSLLTAAGRHVRVTGMRPGTAHIATAYNLTVDGLHTYHVTIGGTSALVHNTCNTRATTFNEGPVPEHVENIVSYREANNGASPPGYGRKPTPFANDGRENGMVLPVQDRTGQPITYKERYVLSKPAPGQVGTEERLVAGSDNSIYYTNDHYLTFFVVRPGTGRRRPNRCVRPPAARQRSTRPAGIRRRRRISWAR